MEKPGISLLDNIIRLYEKESDIHISIHDMSGILQEQPKLSINDTNVIHSTMICDCAKTSAKGLRACLLCKSMSINKAIKLRLPFEGRCYLGISEMVRPVFYNDNLLCIIFVGNYIRKNELEYFYSRASRVSHLTGVSYQNLLQGLSTVELIDESDFSYISDITNTIYDVITLLATHRDQSVSAQPCMAHQVQKRNWLVNLAIDYITAYYDKNLSLQSVANLYHVNPEYFSRLFKKETNMTYTEYLNWVRIDNAKKMLKVTSKRIVQISYDVGFHNVTYFNRVFKEAVGVSPSQYRNGV